MHTYFDEKFIFNESGFDNIIDVLSNKLYQLKKNMGVKISDIKIFFKNIFSKITKYLNFINFNFIKLPPKILVKIIFRKILQFLGLEKLYSLKKTRISNYGLHISEEDFQIIQNVAKQMGFKNGVQVIKYNDSLANAGAAFDTVYNMPVVYISNGLFDMFNNENELKFIIAHELTHIQDKFKIFISNMSLGLIMNALFIGFIYFAFKKFNLNLQFNLIISSFILSVKSMQVLIKQYISRIFEYRADKNAVKTIKDKDAGINSLSNIELYNKFQIYNKLSTQYLNKFKLIIKMLRKKISNLPILSDHPLTDDRIKAIQKLKIDKESFNYNFVNLKHRIF